MSDPARLTLLMHCRGARLAVADAAALAAAVQRSGCPVCASRDKFVLVDLNRYLLEEARRAHASDDVVIDDAAIARTETGAWVQARVWVNTQPLFAWPSGWPRLQTSASEKENPL